MKKTVTRPDGTQEIIEGSPDEIAEFERKQREQSVSSVGEVKENKKSKRVLLNEDDVKRFIEERLVSIHQQCVHWHFDHSWHWPYNQQGLITYPYTQPEITWTPVCPLTVGDSGVAPLTVGVIDVTSNPLLRWPTTLQNSN